MRDLQKYIRQPLQVTSRGFVLDDLRLQPGETLDFGPPLAALPVDELAAAAENYARLSAGACRPQLAALAFDASGRPRALDHYFPLTRLLDAPALAAFDALREVIAAHPNFALRFTGEGPADLTSALPASARAIVAGQLAELFFFRRDLLAPFLTSPRNFQLYASGRAFHQDGGVAGGDYHPGRESIQLGLTRLFEGYYGPAPGVSPFLHEFGHMLDHFDAATGRMGRAEGFYPGLRPSDGPAFTPRARELFIEGKRLELERYWAWHRGAASPLDPLPIGHPYVFQNNGEFAAGYLELFFRTPHYFAAQNPALFTAYTTLFGYDPRPAWESDFPFYVTENRKVYLSGVHPPAPGITVPDD